MNNKDKEYIVRIQDIIDIILDGQDTYIIDSHLMIKLNDYFRENNDIFDEDFIRNYILFIEIINDFFELLIDKLEECEIELLKRKEILSDCIFSFSMEDFIRKDTLSPYVEIIYILEDLFKDNLLLQGITFYLHLNALLKRYKFDNNKIKIIDDIPIIEIDYGNRLCYYKEEYITIFRHELEEGIRSSVFVDNDEIINYVINEIKELKDGLRI